MSTRKHHIEVSSVSLVDLKAEISRRQIEVKQKAQKLENGCSVIRSNHGIAQADRKSIWGKRKPEEVNEDLSLTIPVEDNEDQLQLERSRRTLEAKAKLYEALRAAAMDGNPSYSQMNLNRFHENDCDDDGLLVDFERKAIDDLRRSPTPENLRMIEHKDEADSDVDESGQPCQAECSDDEWTEYTDSMGKKRMCMKKEIAERLSTEPPVKHVDGPLTYAHLREGEIRDHGVGFYAFSEDAEQREAEIARLRELHRATEEGRSRAQIIRTKRDVRMGQRLARLRARKGLPDVATAAAQCLASETVESSAPPTPLPVSADTQSDILLSSDDLDVASMLRRLRDEAEQQRAMMIKQQSQREPEKQQMSASMASNLANWSTGQSTGGHTAIGDSRSREWDRGKSMISAQRYIQTERDKRSSEFAPPSIYK